MVTDIDIADFHYPLPDERIARHPLSERDACKLLVRRPDGSIQDSVFRNIPSILPQNALLVCNNTKVINARLHFYKQSGASIEIFCLEPSQPSDYAISFASTSECVWKCFVGNSKRWRNGLLSRQISVDGKSLTLNAERVAVDGKTSWVKFSWSDPSVNFSRIVDSVGEIPIPPYLNRKSEESDLRDYQTVFSRIEGSVAAPTAGLHFTPSVLDEINSRGILRREVTLHVGAGTFQPVQTDTIGAHVMHHELIDVKQSLIEELASTDRKIVAVGTTSVRTLESLYQLGCRVLEGESIDVVPQWYPYRALSTPLPTRSEALNALATLLKFQKREHLVASTGIIIAPGYEFKVVDAIITNFHQPCSTLLLLVSAFVDGGWRPLYDHALDSGYRFLSYGDAMLLL